MSKRGRGLAGRPAALLGLAGWTGLVGCGQASGPYAVQEVRVVERVEEPVHWNATLAERFAMRAPGAGRVAGTATGPGELTWDTPSGWSEAAPTSMRSANFRVGEAECYLTELAGDGGGLGPNVNRWRSQLGLEPLGADALGALETGEFLGAPATFVDLEGAYSGMSGTNAQDGYRLLGWLSFTADGARFLKMIGPAEHVAEQLENFHALARSFRRGANADPHAGHDHGPGEHGAHGDEPVSFGDSPSSDPRTGLGWTAPAGWLRAPERSMRVVTFHTDESSTAECYVTVLGGDGGGVGDNVNRWREQLGAPRLDASELDGLERIDVLGVEAVLVEAVGAYSGMSGERVPEAALLGAVASLPDRTLFVKLVGEREAVHAAGPAFREFCRSLEVVP